MASSSNERKVQSYLKPKTFNMFKAYATAEKMSESSAANHIITRFFNTMSPEQKESYLHKAKNINSYK